ncbi:MAG: cation diffusion facilitator family transporter [Candidatus Zixiibacteriota bacterium]
MGHHHEADSISGKKLAWTILFNIAITLAEFIGGFISGYLALIADAVHNLSDVAALGLAWLGVKGSEFPATKKSTYGYKRIEVMTAFISAVSLVVIAIFIIIEAYDRFVNPQPLTHPWLFLTVAVIGLVGNIFSIWLLHSDKDKSLNMKTAFLHMAYDAISSVVVIIGGILIFITGLYGIDAVLSLFIAIMIFWSSYLVIKEAVLIFLEAVPEKIDFDEVFHSIKDIPEIEDVHDLHIWSISSKEVALSCHICIDEKDFQKGPGIIAEINKMLNNKLHIGHATIQLEKTECQHPELLCRRDHNHKECN